MAYVPFLNVMETVVNGVLASVPVAMTFGIRKGSAIDVADLEDVNDIFFTWIDNELAPLLSDDLSFTSVKSTNLLTDSSPVVERTIGFPIAGGVVAVPVPNNGALVVSFKTALRGRSYRGRNYVPGVSSGALVTTTQWGSSILASIGAAYALLAADLATAGFEHVVLSRVQEGITLGIGVATRVDSYLPRAKVGSQRGRLQ